MTARYSLPSPPPEDFNCLPLPTPPPDYEHSRSRSTSTSTSTSRGTRDNIRYQQPLRSRFALVQPDVIDRLDDSGTLSYHHEGPYDAVYAERNQDRRLSPVEALRESNAEALKATPPEKIVDCLRSHRPLDGVAFFPPGHVDQAGTLYDYEEGSNMMSDYQNVVQVPCYRDTDEGLKPDKYDNMSLRQSLASLKTKLRLKKRSVLHRNES